MSHLALERHDLGNGIIAYNIGKRTMSAWAYRIGKTLIDSGAPNMHKHFLPFVLQDGDIENIYITHHHEDHSGGATAIREATRARITITNFSQALIQKGYRQYFYQHAVWGNFQPFKEDRCIELPAFGTAVFETNDGSFEIIHAPGHSHDMTVVYDVERKALFSADLYLSTRQRLMRRDEHFGMSVETLRRLLNMDLDIELLLCGHRPVFENALGKLEKKSLYMESLQQQFQDETLASLNNISSAMLDELIGKEDKAFRLLSFGNVSRLNLVKSLLGDVKARPDVIETVGYKLANFDFE